MWGIYILLTVLHMHANISMMRILSLNTLNINRFTIIINDIGNIYIYIYTNTNTNTNTANTNTTNTNILEY